MIDGLKELSSLENLSQEEEHEKCMKLVTQVKPFDPKVGVGSESTKFFTDEEREAGAQSRGRRDCRVLRQGRIHREAGAGC